MLSAEKAHEFLSAPRLKKVCNVTIYIIMQRANFNICRVANLGEYLNPVEVAAGED